MPLLCLENRAPQPPLPGSLAVLPAAGQANQVRLIWSAFGSRSEMPRRWRLDVPVAYDLAAGVGSAVRGSYGVGGPRERAVVLPPVEVTPQSSPPVPGRTGYYRTTNFHFTQDTPGSSAAFELRVGPPLPYLSRIKQIVITPLVPGTTGQFVDVRFGPDRTTTDVSAFEGSSVLLMLDNPQVVPAPDDDPGIQVPDQTVVFTDVGQLIDAGQHIRVVAYFLAPAVGMPIVHVSVTTEDYDGATAPVAVRPLPVVGAVRPRAAVPPVGPAGAPPPAPSSPAVPEAPVRLGPELPPNPLPVLPAVIPIPPAPGVRLEASFAGARILGVVAPDQAGDLPGLVQPGEVLASAGPLAAMLTPAGYELVRVGPSALQAVPGGG